MEHSTLRPGQGTDYDWSNDHVFVKTPVELTGGRVTVVEDTLKPGFQLARHHHRSMIEIFYVVAGSVTFTFDDETVVAGVGTTVNVPPGVWHGASSAEGGRLITVFSPGGFDQYLAELAAMDASQFDDVDVMTALAEKYDIWTR